MARPERSEGIAGRKGNAGGNLHIMDTFQASYKVEHRIKPTPLQNHNVIARIPLPPFGHLPPRVKGAAAPLNNNLLHFSHQAIRDVVTEARSVLGYTIRKGGICDGERL